MRDSGLFPGIPAAEYHRREPGVVSASALSRFARSPAHYQAWLREPTEPDTPALVFGRAVHCAILEPGLFDGLFPAKPLFSGKGAVAARAEWLASLPPGASPMDADDLDRVHRIADAVRSHPVVRAALDTAGALRESTLRWQDAETGLDCKARPDLYLPSGVVLDFKTTEDARPGPFARSIATYRYAIQAAHYSAGFRAIGNPLYGFMLVAIEKSPPFAVATYRIGERSECAAFDQYTREVGAFAECVRSGVWPAYPTNTTDIELPTWALKEAEEAIA